ncbi:MAG: 50S ribosomal protein L11 methyltransferase [Pseudobdellovibrionaceae bacterium]
MNSFIRIRLSQVPAAFEDVITQHCFDYGATGLTEALQFVQPDLTYDPKILLQKNQDIDVYFTERPNSGFFDKLREWAPSIQWHIFEEESKDWLAEWKKGFQSFQLAGPYWIVPSWLTAPQEAQVPILIDPGMAFGTGTHDTTKMASWFVHKVGQKLGSLEKDCFLDVGTGTALLAILAHHEGFQKVVGLEIDPEARRVARENVERNGAKAVNIPEEQIEKIDQDFPVVVANIIDGVLIFLKNDLIRVLRSGGHLFVTGILAEREDLFAQQFIENSPFEIVRRLEQGEWIGYWLRKR